MSNRFTIDESFEPTLPYGEPEIANIIATCSHVLDQNKYPINNKTEFSILEYLQNHIPWHSKDSRIGALINNMHLKSLEQPYIHLPIFLSPFQSNEITDEKKAAAVVRVFEERCAPFDYMAHYDQIQDNEFVHFSYHLLQGSGILKPTLQSIASEADDIGKELLASRLGDLSKIHNKLADLHSLYNDLATTVDDYFVINQPANKEDTHSLKRTRMKIDKRAKMLLKNVRMYIVNDIHSEQEMTKLYGPNHHQLLRGELHNLDKKSEQLDLLLLKINALTSPIATHQTPQQIYEEQKKHYVAKRNS